MTSAWSTPCSPTSNERAYFSEHVCSLWNTLIFGGEIIAKTDVPNLYIHSSKGLSLQHGLGEILQGVSDTQVRQDLLRATKDGIELVCTMEHFDYLAHATLSERTTAKDVDGFVCDLVSSPGAVGLEQADGASEMFELFDVAHVTHLVGD